MAYSSLPRKKLRYCPAMEADWDVSSPESGIETTAGAEVDGGGLTVRCS